MIASAATLQETINMLPADAKSREGEPMAAAWVNNSAFVRPDRINSKEKDRFINATHAAISSRCSTVETAIWSAVAKT